MADVGFKGSVAVLGALVVFLCAGALLWQILPGISALELDAEFERADRVIVYYSNTARGGYTEKHTSDPVPFARGRSVKKIRFENRHPNYLRIGLGRSPGVIKIHRLTLYSHFAPPLILSPEEIQRRFVPGRKGIEMKLQETYLAVTAQGEDPYIRCTSHLFDRKTGLCLVIALLVSIGAYLLLSRLDLSALAAVADLKGKNPGSGDYITALDGLRGCAALMVIADHTWGMFTGTGTSGVWIFFALSGFLLARPFALSPEKIASPGYWAAYGQRRLVRILPMYYFYIFIIYALNKRFDVAILHLLFLQADGHLWAIPQEILFYLLVPPVMLGIHFILRNRVVPILLFLLSLIILCNRYLDINVLGLLGQNHSRLRPFAGVFFSGVFFCFAYYRFYANLNDDHWLKQRARSLLSWLGTALLVIFFFCSTGRLWGNPRVFGQEYFGAFGFLSGWLVFCVMAAEDGVLRRVLCWTPLRALGIVGLSLYLLHPLVSIMITESAAYYGGETLKGGKLFAATVLGAYAVAFWTYSAIEQPAAARISRFNRSCSGAGDRPREAPTPERRPAPCGEPR